MNSVAPNGWISRSSGLRGAAIFCRIGDSSLDFIIVGQGAAWLALTQRWTRLFVRYGGRHFFGLKIWTFCRFISGQLGKPTLNIHNKLGIYGHYRAFHNGHQPLPGKSAGARQFLPPPIGNFIPPIFPLRSYSFTKVTAPSEAEETSAAYFENTPRL